MQFTNTLFLFGLFALLVPIFIHLFNFRRYKIVHFSNVKLLQNILQKTKKESQLQHLIVLFLRILGITAIVFAMAQPFIPNPIQEEKGNKTVALYVDNSSSMSANAEQGNMLLEATNAAKNIVKAFSFDDEFILLTNDFSGAHSKVMNKNEMINAIDEVQISTQNRTTEEIIAHKENVAKYAQASHSIQYFISDFQSNNIDFNAILADTIGVTNLYQVPSQQVGNVSVDSCWFSAPIFRGGYQAVLNVKISNYSENDLTKLPVKLYINEKQKAIAAIDIKANSSAVIAMNYTMDEDVFQNGKVEINDFPINFDDAFYFSYEVMPQVKVLSIFENENRYLQTLFGKDSTFSYEEMNVDKINYSRFKDFSVIILDQIENLSSGLASELEKAVKAGATLLIFPGENTELTALNSLLLTLESPAVGTLVEETRAVSDINMESRYFVSSLEKKPEQGTLPTLQKYFPITSVSSAEVLMQLENQNPFLLINSCQKGSIVLAAAPLNETFGDAHRNAIAVLAIHNVVLMNQQPQELYYIVGENGMATLSLASDHSKDIISLVNYATQESFIPSQRALLGDIQIYFDQNVQNAGFYEITCNDEKLGVVAFNWNRDESNLTYVSTQELRNLAVESDGRVKIVEPSQNLTQVIEEQLVGTPLWKLFVMIALGCFLLEILVLRFWGRARSLR